MQPAGGKGLTSDLLGSPNQPQAAGSPSRLPARWPPASPTPCPATDRFHLLTGGRFTAGHPGPSTRLPSARLLRVGCKSPDRPQSGPRARVPHPTAGQTVAAVSGLWPHQGQAEQPRRRPSGFRWAHIVPHRRRCSSGPAQLCCSPLPASAGLLSPSHQLRQDAELPSRQSDLSASTQLSALGGPGEPDLSSQAPHSVLTIQV